MGEYTEALRVFNQALALHRTIGDRAGEAASRYNLGVVYHSLGNYEMASQLFEKALTLHQSIGDRRGQAASFYQLGFLHHRLDDYSKALVFLDEALSILREVHDPWALGKTLTYYGWTLSLVKRWEEAENYLVEALQVDRELQQQAAVIQEKALLSALALAQQDLILADDYAQEILSYLELHGTHGMEHPAMVYLSCYYVLHANQQVEQAKAVLQQAWQLISQKSTKIDDPILQQSYCNQVPEHKTIQELLQQ
jgi:tetratricopeptide (TPR) repeat protein